MKIPQVTGGNRLKNLYTKSGYDLRQDEGKKRFPPNKK